MNSLSSGGGIGLFSSATMSGLKRPCPENSDDSSDSDSECTIVPQDMLSGLSSSNGTLFIDGPKPGKKTKGRVKIKMEFIENKLRRYTTFSKRKTGIMKKAYELSTLTGTQVMLLVASETGHVYTFATRKLQPMITSESGKALIQTCLNSPDSPLDVGKVSSDQRMNPTGYEETDLSYAVSDDETCQPASSSPCKTEVTKSSTPSSAPSVSSRCQPGAKSSASVETPSNHHHLYQLGQDIAASSRPQSSLATASDLCLKQEPTSTHVSFTKDINSSSSHSQPRTKDEVLVSRAAAATTAATISLPSSTADFSLGTASSLVMPSALLHQNQSTPGRHPSQLQPTFYKIPGTNQIISLALTGASSQGTVLYQTYTTPSSSGGSSTLPEGYLLNLPQAPVLSKALEASRCTDGAAQQFITIPVPVSLANSSQMFHPLFAQSASIKSELLPTDLRYNSLEKPAK